MSNSLWGEDFVIKETPKQAKKIVDKINKPVKKVTSVTKSKSISVSDKLKFIYSEVNRVLGHYDSNTMTIRTKEEFIDYIDKAISNGVIAIDTETNNSLDPLTCKLMGPCIYTPGMKSAYIPINHVDSKTLERLSWQLTEEDIREQFARLTDTKIIMHNGKFDYEVIKCTCNLELNIYWDTMIAAKILNENELRAGLKQQYIDKIDSSQEKYDIEHLFEGVEYSVVDPEMFALYSATDAYMTYMLYKWQEEQFKNPGNEKLLDLLLNVEMPVVQVAAEMELTGVCIDTDYAKRLSIKYHKKLDDIDTRISDELLNYSQVICDWRTTAEANYHPISKKANKDGDYVPQKSKSEQLQDPVQVTSPTQLAILLYDVLKTPVIDNKSPRGTGEEILNKIDIPLCKLILEKRGLEKLLGTYIDKLPECISTKDNRLHAHFNQLGAGTGRFSSSDPNLQNIPSHQKNVRLMFKASDGCMFVGADFSQQEPRLLANYSQDPSMVGAYKEGKDLYATIATGVYKNSYWDNMEHHEDGTPNPEGKKRRSNCKSLLLGIMYGRGANSIAEQIGSTYEEAQKIVDDFYTGFPKVKEWVTKTESDAKVNGYVEDFCGRRRRLPDIQLPKYTIKSNSSKSDFNPLLFSKGLVTNCDTDLIKKYEKKLQSVKSRKDYNTIKDEALKNGISIVDNGGFISQAQRQCVNARVQGGAASMSKIAMRKVFDSEELRNLGFKTLLQIHDELIGECPAENAEKVAEVLTTIMKNSVSDKVDVPFKCDADISPCWYYNDFKDTLQESFKKLVKSGLSEQDSYFKLFSENSEFTKEQFDDFLDFQVEI